MPAAQAAPAARCKRPRLTWTPELHARFEKAVAALGGLERAQPHAIQRLMSVPGLLTSHIKSHLQKVRQERGVTLPREPPPRAGRCGRAPAKPAASLCGPAGSSSDDSATSTEARARAGCAAGARPAAGAPAPGAAAAEGKWRRRLVNVPARGGGSARRELRQRVALAMRMQTVLLERLQQQMEVRWGNLLGFARTGQLRGRAP